MKTFWIIVVAVAIVAVLGWTIVPNLGAHINARGKRVADYLDDKASLNTLVDIAKDEAEKCRGKIRNYHVNISRGEIKANLIAEDVEELKERKAGNEAILKKVKTVLANSQPGNSITVNNKSYTWEQVNQDALLRIDRCKALDTEIKEKEILLEGLSREIEEAKSQLVIATNKVNELTGKIQEWEAKIAAKQVEVQVSELVKAIKGDPLGSASGVTRAMNALQNRYLELEADLRVTRETAVGTGRGEIVDWEAEVGPRNATEAINAYFGTEPPASTEEPAAAEPEPESAEPEVVILSPDVNN